MTWRAISVRSNLVGQLGARGVERREGAALEREEQEPRRHRRLLVHRGELAGPQSSPRHDHVSFSHRGAAAISSQVSSGHQLEPRRLSKSSPSRTPSYDVNKSLTCCGYLASIVASVVTYRGHKCRGQRGKHAWQACVASMRGKHAWQACVASMRGKHACPACVASMRGKHDASAPTTGKLL